MDNPKLSHNDHIKTSGNLLLGTNTTCLSSQSNTNSDMKTYGDLGSTKSYSNLSTSDSNDTYSMLAIEENNRFVKHGPLLTMLILTVGPFLTTAGQSVLESLDLYFVSKRFQNDKDSFALQIIGMGFYVVLIATNFCMFFAHMLITRVSGLIGEGRRDDASQLVANVFILSFIVCLFAQILLTFCSTPIMLFAGCSTDLIEKCFSLASVQNSGLTICVFFHTTCAFLQGIGKPVSNGLYHLTANILQTFIFTPFLQFVLKIDVTLSNLSQTLAQALVGIFLFIRIMRGKYSLRPNFSLFFNGSIFTSTELRKALITAFPIFPSMIFIILPPMYLLRLMTSAASLQAQDEASQIALLSTTTDTTMEFTKNFLKMAAEDRIKDIIAFFTVLQKTSMIGSAIPIALSYGMLSSGTHSLGNKNYKRLMSTIIWCFSLSLLFLIPFISLMLINPNLLADPFMNVESAKVLAKEYLPIPYYTFTMQTLCVPLSILFIVFRHPNLSTLMNILMVTFVCVCAKIISLKYPKDPKAILYAYTITDTISFIMTGSAALYFILKTKRDMKKQGNETEFLTNSTDFYSIEDQTAK